MAILGALVALGGIPLGLILYRATDDEAFADRFSEGGLAMYALVGVAALAAFLAAMSAFLAPRGALVLRAGSAFVSLAMSAFGAVSYAVGATGMVKAAIYAAPGDRGPFMRGAIGELNQVLILVAAFASALFVTQGLALIVRRFAAKEAALRQSLLLLGLGLLAIGAWQGFSALELAGERAALKASAHASPVERLSLVTEGFERMASNHQLSLIALFLAGVVAAGGVVLRRGDRRFAAMVFLGIVVPVVGLGGGRAAAQVDSFGRELLARPYFDRDLLALDAPPVDVRFTFLTVGSELVGANGNAPQFEYMNGADVGLGLEPGVTMEALVKALRQLRAASVSSVTLVGTIKTPLPASVPELYAALFDEPRGLPLGLALWSDCDEGCETAKLDGRGLTWGDRTWPLETSSAFQAYDPKSIPLAADGLTLESLLSACHTVGNQGGKIVLVLPK